MYFCLRLTEQYKLNTNIPFPISSLLRKFDVIFCVNFAKEQNCTGNFSENKVQTTKLSAKNEKKWFFDKKD